MYKRRQVAVIVPALNEAQSIGKVLSDLNSLRVCRHCGDALVSNRPAQCPDQQKDLCRADSKPLVDLIVVGDNGSTDGTASIARMHSAVVVHEPERGYGAACLAALRHPAAHDLVAFVDADDSVDVRELPGLLDPLVNGANLVIGSRAIGQCEKGALSLPQRFGNWLASALIRRLWKEPVTDLGPFRAIDYRSLKRLNMSDRHYGWTVEMQVRALQLSLHVREVPVSALVRIGQSKISGTVRGVIGAANGILGTIARLYIRQHWMTGCDTSAQVPDPVSPSTVPIRRRIATRLPASAAVRKP